MTDNTSGKIRTRKKLSCPADRWPWPSVFHATGLMEAEIGKIVGFANDGRAQVGAAAFEVMRRDRAASAMRIGAFRSIGGSRAVLRHDGRVRSQRGGTQHGPGIRVARALWDMRRKRKAASENACCASMAGVADAFVHCERTISAQRIGYCDRAEIRLRIDPPSGSRGGGRPIRTAQARKLQRQDMGRLLKRTT